MAVRLVGEEVPQESDDHAYIEQQQRAVEHSARMAQLKALQEQHEHLPPPARPKPPPPIRDARMMELMGVVARILGFRIQLFAAFLGAIGLGSYAVYNATQQTIIVFTIYAVLVFIPALFVAYKRG